MRDISFRDVLDTLGQREQPHQPRADDDRCRSNGHGVSPASTHSPSESPSLTMSPSTVAMTLLATASLQLRESCALRPLAIRPRYDAESVPSLGGEGMQTAPDGDQSTPVIMYRKPHVKLAPKPAPQACEASLPATIPPESGPMLADRVDQNQKQKRRKTRVCREPGCEKYVVDHGLCIAHGGGKRCSVDGCDCRAQNRGLCWKHGGFTICTIEGCTKRAKSRGICWTHGGGTKCKAEDCEKIAVSHGRCWAHGGGKRCQIKGCKKPASERMNNFCADHFEPIQGSAL